MYNCYDNENIQTLLQDTVDIKQYSFDIREQLKQRPPVPPPMKTELALRSAVDFYV